MTTDVIGSYVPLTPRAKGARHRHQLRRVFSRRLFNLIGRAALARGSHLLELRDFFPVKVR